MHAIRPICGDHGGNAINRELEFPLRFRKLRLAATQSVFGALDIFDVVTDAVPGDHVATLVVQWNAA